jgi:cupin fold WbuC family metalloprotein
MNHPLALPGPRGDIVTLDAELLARGVEASRTSPRQRVMVPLQRRLEGVQRLLNFLQPGSYIRPHRHPLPEHVETIVVLQGAIGVLEFTPEGGVRTTWALRAGRVDACLVDIDAGVWHGLVVQAPDTVILEIKRGPYDAARDKEFPEWAPLEGAEGCAPALREWLGMIQAQTA